MLQVKFQWKKRLRTKPEAPCKQTQSTASSYRKKCKETNPTKYKINLENDAIRKKSAYKPIKTRTEEGKKKAREKWNQSKKRQRKILEKNDMEPPKKKMKEMTQDEKKEYFKLKMRESRENMSSHKKVHKHKLDRERKKKQSSTKEILVHVNTIPIRTPVSARSLRRKRKNITSILPNTPNSRSAILSKVLINERTPIRQSVRRQLIKDDNSCQIVENIKTTINSAKQKPSNLNRSIVHTVGKAASNSRHKLGKKLGLTWRTWKKMKMNPTGKFTRTRNNGKISDEVKSLVREFWWSGEASRQLPLKKRVKRGLPLYVLECSYTTCYRRFKAAYPDVKIGYVKYISLKPSNVRLLKALERIVCCCIKCENVKLKVKAINQVCTSSGLKCKLPSDERDLAKMTMCCREDDSKYHAKNCIERKCVQCGVDKIKDHLSTLLRSKSDEEVSVLSWQKVSKVREVAGVQKISKVTELVTTKLSIADATTSLMDDMHTLAGHLFRAQWQLNQLTAAKSNILAKSAVVVMDFSENYKCSTQNEVQSAHWSYIQATIHPIMAYVNASDSKGNITNVVSDIHISDDLMHDNFSVNHYLLLTYKRLISQFGITSVVEFSDCCAQQYRSKNCFRDLSLRPSLLGINVNHNYFEASHGKNASDGLGAVVKYGATKAVTRREAVIRSPLELFQYCSENLTEVGQSVFPSSVKKFENSERRFVYVQKGDIIREQRSELKTVKGTLGIHCVKVLSKGKLKSRNLSCFCTSCQQDNVKCKAGNYLGEWRTFTMVDENDQMDDHKDAASSTKTPMTLQTNSFVASFVGGNRRDWYIGRIDEVDEESSEVKLSFMKSSGDNYTWPNEDDSSWEPYSNIIMVLKQPSLISNNRLIYRFDKHELDSC